MKTYPLKIGVGDLGVEFGPGIAMYFNFLTWMGHMFFILFVLNFPTILIAHAAKYYGPYSHARNSTGYSNAWDEGFGGFDMASTTLGAIAPDDVEEGEWLIFDWNGMILTISKLDFLYGSMLMDLLGVVMFFIMLYFLNRRNAQIERRVDLDTIEISDYTVVVKGLPEDAGDKEEVRCFFELKFGKVVDAVLAKSDGSVVSVYRRRGALSMIYDTIHSRYIKKGKKKDKKKMEKLEKLVAKKDAKIAKLKRQKFFKTKLAFVTFNDEESYVDCLEQSPKGWFARWMMPREERFRGKHSYTVDAAPPPTDVMYENLHVSEKSRRKRRFMVGLVSVALLAVSFFGISALSKNARDMAAAVKMSDVKLAEGAEGPGGGEFANYPWTVANASSVVDEDEYEEYDGDAEPPPPPPPPPSGGASGGALTFPADFNGTHAFDRVCTPTLAQCEVAYSEPGLLTLMPFGDFMTVVPIGVAMSETEKRVKIKTLVKDLAACADPNGCQKRDEHDDVLFGCLACYCAGLQYGVKSDRKPGKWEKGDFVMSTFTNKELADIKEHCAPYLVAPGGQQAIMLIAASASVSVVNTLLKFFLKFLSPLERPDSFIALQRTIAEKVFIAQFVNTALVMLIINAAIPEIANIFANFVFAGDYRDFDTLWYEDIGGPLLLTMMVNAVVPSLMNVVGEMKSSAQRCVGRCTAWTQKKLNEIYTGPEFDIATRYGEMLMCITVTLMYGSGMPFLYVFACFYMFAISYFDRRMLLRCARRPPRYGTDLAELALAVVPWALFAHMLLGLWMHTYFLTPSVQDSTGYGKGSDDGAATNTTQADEVDSIIASGASVDNLVELARNASAAAAANEAGYSSLPDEIDRRAVQTNGFAFLLLIALFLAYMILKTVLKKLWGIVRTIFPCFDKCCGKTKIEVEDNPTFEDALMTDKLRGVTTYEMRDMPMYADIFYEGKAPKTPRKGEKEDADDSAYGATTTDDDTDADADVDDALLAKALFGGATAAEMHGDALAGKSEDEIFDDIHALLGMPGEGQVAGLGGGGFGFGLGDDSAGTGMAMKMTMSNNAAYDAGDEDDDVMGDVNNLLGFGGGAGAGGGAFNNPTFDADAMAAPTPVSASATATATDDVAALMRDVEIGGAASAPPGESQDAPDMASLLGFGGGGGAVGLPGMVPGGRVGPMSKRRSKRGAKTKRRGGGTARESDGEKSN